MGGHLVAINDAAEGQLLLDLFGTRERSWIGLNDVQVEGTFVWSNGDPVTYLNWAPGEPNNSGNEDFALTNDPSGTADLWYDAPAVTGFRGIAEIAPAAVPEPASIVILGTFAIGLLGWGWHRRRAARV